MENKRVSRCDLRAKVEGFLQMGYPGVRLKPWHDENVWKGQYTHREGLHPKWIGWMNRSYFYTLLNDGMKRPFPPKLLIIIIINSKKADKSLVKSSNNLHKSHCKADSEGGLRLPCVSRLAAADRSIYRAKLYTVRPNTDGFAVTASWGQWNSSLIRGFNKKCPINLAQKATYTGG